LGTRKEGVADFLPQPGAFEMIRDP
jgi:hypothetical protein